MNWLDKSILHTWVVIETISKSLKSAQPAVQKYWHFMRRAELVNVMIHLITIFTVKIYKWCTNYLVLLALPVKWSIDIKYIYIYLSRFVQCKSLCWGDDISESHTVCALFGSRVVLWWALKEPSHEGKAALLDVWFPCEGVEDGIGTAADKG